ncbi:MAG: hypothetical protein K0U47_02715 [Epsilonproteobacteria bacterium]|nr:hypothetical protein [Campylobacterota bacterium]
MIAKLKKVLQNDGALFTLSSLVYSFSTYLIALTIPYALDIKMMADFSATFNIVMIFSFIFEFGLSTSYLRFNQIYNSTDYINTYFQIFIFALLGLFYFTVLGNYLGDIFGFESIDLSTEYIYLSTFAVLSWIFFKNIYLSNKKIKFILLNTIILLLIRVGFLVYIFTQNEMVSLDNIYLYLFITPFALIAIFNMKYNVAFVVKSIEKIKDRRHISIFRKRFKQLLAFSILAYLINSLYIYTSRYAMVYLTDEGLTELLAELGYAFSFGGLIMIFTVSIRLYLISKFNISNVDEIIKYVKQINGYKYLFFAAAIAFSAFVAYTVYLIKPDYLSERTSIFLFILIFSYMIIAYYSMFTLLSKTFDFNKLELALNVVRLILVMLATHLLLGKYPIIGFAVVSFCMVVIEYIFAKIVLKRVLKKEK